MENEKLTNDEILMFYKKVVQRFNEEIIHLEDGHRHKHKYLPLISHKQTDNVIDQFHIKIKNFPLYTDLKNEKIEDDMIIQCSKEEHTFYNLYKYLRNSIAHGYVEKHDKYYYFEDCTDKDELVMAAHLKMEDFEQFIDDIYNKSKKYQEEN